MPEAKPSPKGNLSLEQFKAIPEPEAWARYLGKISGGTFTECHMTVQRQTGLWIEELVPVFQKLDALARR
jgi:hypothetical protein